jgi:hypothetical protein
MAEFNQMRRAHSLKQACIAVLVSLGALNVALTAVTLAHL